MADDLLRDLGSRSPRHASTSRYPPSPAPGDGDAIYIVLLDGYPREDTLASLGIEIRPFISRLEDRGFEYYPQAASRHDATALALTAMLTDRQIDAREYASDQAAVRASWVLPEGFVAIAPPVGHVNLPSARTIDSGGMNDFEADLLGQSALHFLPWTGMVIKDALRDRLEDALELLATTDHLRVFAHLVAPHPPFLYSGEMRSTPPCWPSSCHIFTNVVENLRIPRSAWIAGMADNIAHLDETLIETIDRILERRPDATIVLFSDHGGRMSREDRAEYHRTFLAARTPGYPGWFADDPGPDRVFSVVDR